MTEAFASHFSTWLGHFHPDHGALHKAGDYLGVRSGLSPVFFLHSVCKKLIKTLLNVM